METGVWRNSGTSARVAFTLHGSKANSSEIVIDNNIVPDRALFSRGNVDKFMITLPDHLGSLLYMRIWHDNSGSNPSWFLKKIAVRDLENDHEYILNCGRWLSLIDGDGSIEQTLTVSTASDAGTFSDVFQRRSADGITDNHLWISVVAKSPASRFTRVQRATCCLSFLFAVMITNAMFYNLSNKAEKTIQIGPLQFSWRQVIVGMQSSLIAVPINLLIVQMFRKASQWKDENKSSEVDFDNRQPGKFSYTKLPSKRHSRRILATLCLIIVYFICFVVVALSGIFTTFYSMFWGKDISNQWLASLLVSFVQDIFVMQPIKIILLAVFLSLLVNKHVIKRKGRRQSRVSPVSSHTYMKEDNCASKRDPGKCVPPSEEEKTDARILAKKEKAFSSSARELLLYVVFMLLICVVCYGDRSEHRYRMTKSVLDRIEVPGQVTIALVYHCIIKS